VTTGVGAFLFTLPDPERALRPTSPWRASGLEPCDGLAEAPVSVGLRDRFAPIPDPPETEGLIAPPISDVFLEARPRLFELILPLVLPEESAEPLRLGLLVGCVIDPPIRLRLFEPVAGCLAIVEVDDFLVVICLPIRERVLLFEPVAGCLVETEFEGRRVVT